MIGISDIVFFILGLFAAVSFPEQSEWVRTKVKAGIAKTRDWIKGLAS